MDTLVLKLVLTPALIGLISLAGRRWGPSVSGLLVGLPLTSGPLVFFVALQQATAFATATAMGILAGTMSQAAFCVIYSRLAFRFRWTATLLLSISVFLGCTFILQSFSPPLIPLYGFVVASLLLALRLASRTREEAASIPPTPLPRWDIPARMLVATPYLVVITSLAPLLGPHLTGLLSPFPLYAAILAVFAHHLQGPASSVRVVNGLLLGLFGFSTFFLVLSALLPRVGLGVAFAAAIGTVLAIQSVAWWILRRAQRPLSDWSAPRPVP